MSSDSGEKKPSTTPPPPPTGKNTNQVKKEPEQLPCPRCNSINTKFCYYNNYNFSQPRHFCKACRRYWTHGGALRDIPVGGATRKNAKRARLSTPPVCSGNNNSLMIPFTGDYSGNGGGGSFTSLLSASQNQHFQQHHGFFGFDQDLSFGVGRTFWPFNGGVHGGGITWQMESGRGDFVLPELAITTPGNTMKSNIN